MNYFVDKNHWRKLFLLLPAPLPGRPPTDLWSHTGTHVCQKRVTWTSHTAQEWTWFSSTFPHPRETSYCTCTVTSRDQAPPPPLAVLDALHHWSTEYLSTYLQYLSNIKTTLYEAQTGSTAKHPMDQAVCVIGSPNDSKLLPITRTSTRLGGTVCSWQLDQLLHGLASQVNSISQRGWLFDYTLVRTL